MKKNNITLVTATFTALSLFSALSHAHPGWVMGTSNLTLTNRGPASVTDPITGVTTPAKAATSAAGASRGYLEDGIRIGHGCSNDDGQYDPKTATVNAVSWIWPTGENASDLAPMSTGCDEAGKNCTGSATQPSVATIPNSGQKPNYKNAAWPAGVATAANLSEHLCVSKDCTARVTSLGSLFTAQGNQGYFKQFQAKKGTPGFWAKGKKMTPEEIAAFSANYGVPFASAVQVQYVADRKQPLVPMVFSPQSCARKLVVRPAGADICKIRNDKVIQGHPHDQNFWFGGPTPKFVEGHGVNENFWMGYNLLVRDTTANPYPESCQDKVYGDYDLVVMTPISQIDSFLGFPGFAKGKP